MFTRILRAIGLGRPEPLSGLPELLKKIKPKELSGEIVSGGDPNHSHEFKEVPWESRLGSDFTNPDRDHGIALEFPMATFKELYRCSCGREVVKSVRALI